VMLTAKTRDADRVQGIETGADAYVTKPFDINNLLEIIRNHIL